MKIGIDVSQVVYQGTGVATYTRELVRALLTLDKKNEYVLFGSTLRRQKELSDFFRILPQNTFKQKTYIFPPSFLNLLFNQLHLVNIENFSGDVDLFHTSDWVEPKAKAPKVTTIHDLIVYKYPEYLNKKIVETQKKKLTWVSQESKAIIADSESTKKDIVEYLGISPSRIHVVYLGIDQNFKPVSTHKIQEVTQRFHLVGQYVLCVGTREPRKNLDRVLSAFEMLGKDDISLVIVGNPGWGQDIKPRANVKMLNYVSREELVALYSGAACFVYPSLYEGFGLPILEAMACEILVVTSQKGSLGELAKDHAIVVEPESVDAIHEGIKKALNMTASKKSDIIKRAKKYAATFTWEETARKTLEIYKSII